MSIFLILVSLTSSIEVQVSSMELCQAKATEYVVKGLGNATCEIR